VPQGSLDLTKPTLVVVVSVGVLQQPAGMSINNKLHNFTENFTGKNTALKHTEIQIYLSIHHIYVFCTEVNLPQLHSFLHK